jgi:hypothetical protein
VPVVMSNAAAPVEIIPGHRESYSGVEQKPFAIPPESLFAFSQESFGSIFSSPPQCGHMAERVYQKT